MYGVAAPSVTARFTQQQTEGVGGKGKGKGKGEGRVESGNGQELKENGRELK